MRPAFLDLIVRARETYHCEYEGYLTNHLLHFVVAADALGLSLKQTVDFCNEMKKRLEPAKPRGTPVTNCLDASASPSFLGLFDFFEERSFSFDQVVDSLAPSCGTAAFHGLIHAGFGVRSGEPVVLSEGLAYWCYCPRLQTALNAAGTWPSNDLAGALNKFRAERIKPPLAKLPFTEAMASINSNATLQKSLAPLDIAVGGIEDPLETAKSILFQLSAAFPRIEESRDFFVLHLVTSAYALVQVVGRLQSAEVASRLVAYFWRSVLMAYARQGYPEVRPGVSASCTEAEFEASLVTALALNDEHLVKMGLLAKEQKLQAPYGGAFVEATKAVSSLGYKY